VRNVLLMAIVVLMAATAAACTQATPTPTEVPPTPVPVGPTVAVAPTAAVTSTAGLAGTSWLLVTLGGQEPVTKTTVTLKFGADGRVSGSDGCNTFGAPYTSDATTLAITQPMVTTLMACEQPIMDQATAYQKALGEAKTYKIAGQQLTLSDATGKELATLTAQPTGLVGTAWDVISYNNGKEAVVSVLAGTTLTAIFAAEGKLSGSAGCNNYSAEYESDASNIAIGAVATTRKMCAEPAGVMDQEAAYTAALQTAATYTIDGDKLELRTAANAIAATFARAEVESESVESETGESGTPESESTESEAGETESIAPAASATSP
jgi:heat shock protein HslJ